MQALPCGRLTGQPCVLVAWQFNVRKPLAPSLVEFAFGAMYKSVEMLLSSMKQYRFDCMIALSYLVTHKSAFHVAWKSPQAASGMAVVLVVSGSYLYMGSCQNQSYRILYVGKSTGFLQGLQGSRNLENPAHAFRGLLTIFLDSAKSKLLGPLSYD